MRPTEPRRADDRSVTRRDGIVTWHSFSFGPHYDPAFTGVGSLVALNEELIGPGSGYDDHRHAALDVVTWVTAGRVAHTDAVSGARVLGAGTVGVLRAGPGVVHAEGCPAGADGPARMLQSWLVAPSAGAPSYDAVEVAPQLEGGRFTAVAAGPGGPSAPLALSVAGAVLWVARLGPGGSAALPPLTGGWLHLAAGTLECAPQGPGPRVVLAAGDGLLLEGPGGSPPAEQVGVSAGGEGAEVLVWALPEE